MPHRWQKTITVLLTTAEKRDGPMPHGWQKTITVLLTTVEKSDGPMPQRMAENNNGPVDHGNNFIATVVGFCLGSHCGKIFGI